MCVAGCMLFVSGLFGVRCALFVVCCVFDGGMGVVSLLRVV